MKKQIKKLSLNKKTIANGKMSEGYHRIEWNRKDKIGKGVPAGIYVL